MAATVLDTADILLDAPTLTDGLNFCTSPQEELGESPWKQSFPLPDDTAYWGRRGRARNSLEPTYREQKVHFCDLCGSNVPDGSDWALCDGCAGLNPVLSLKTRQGTQQSSSTNSRKSKRKRSKQYLPLQAVTILENWLARNSKDPYPNAMEKNELVKSTGLTRRQIEVWLSNARQRREGIGPQMDPMELWLSSEDEFVSLENITQASASEYYHTPSFGSGFGIPKRQESFGARSNASSMSSCGSAFFDCPEAIRHGPAKRGRKKYMQSPSGSSVGSVGTDNFLGDLGAIQQNGETMLFAEFASPNNKFTTFGSSAPTTPDVLQPLAGPSISPQQHTNPPCNTEHHPDNGGPAESQAKPIQYQCTFCHISLSPRAWKRHEETQHLPKKHYICLPPPIVASERCVFCALGRRNGDANPKAPVLDCGHRMGECLSRSIDQRTFNRRDKFVAHLRGYHKCRGWINPVVVEQWGDVKDYGERWWECGFCGEKMLGWEERAKHVGRHFQEGKDMSEWRSWGASVSAWVQDLDQGKDWSWMLSSD